MSTRIASAFLLLIELAVLFFARGVAAEDAGELRAACEANGKHCLRYYDRTKAWLTPEERDRVLLKGCREGVIGACGVMLRIDSLQATAAEILLTDCLSGKPAMCPLAEEVESKAGRLEPLRERYESLCSKKMGFACHRRAMLAAGAPPAGMFLVLKKVELPRVKSWLAKGCEYRFTDSCEQLQMIDAQSMTPSELKEAASKDRERLRNFRLQAGMRSGEDFEREGDVVAAQKAYAQECEGIESGGMKREGPYYACVNAGRLLLDTNPEEAERWFQKACKYGEENWFTGVGALGMGGQGCDSAAHVEQQAGRKIQAIEWTRKGCRMKRDYSCAAAQRLEGTATPSLTPVAPETAYAPSSTPTPVSVELPIGRFLDKRAMKVKIQELASGTVIKQLGDDDSFFKGLNLMPGDIVRGINGRVPYDFSLFARELERSLNLTDGAAIVVERAGTLLELRVKLSYEEVLSPSLPRLLPDESKAIASAISRLSDSDLPTRRAAILKLGEIGMNAAHTAAPKLVPLLEDRELYTDVMNALQKMGLAAFPALQNGLRSDKAKVIGGSLIRLQSLGLHSRPAVPFAIELLDHTDPGVRREAIRLIEYAGGPLTLAAPPRLIALLRDSDKDVRRGAAQTLGTVGRDSSEAVDALREIRNDAKADREQRDAADRALRALGKL